MGRQRGRGRRGVNLWPMFPLVLKFVFSYSHSWLILVYRLLVCKLHWEIWKLEWLLTLWIWQEKNSVWCMLQAEVQPSHLWKQQERAAQDNERLTQQIWMWPIKACHVILMWELRALLFSRFPYEMSISYSKVVVTSCWDKSKFLAVQESSCLHYFRTVWGHLIKSLVPLG